MHHQAELWIAQHATDEKVSVLDIGGRNINGSAKVFFPNATSYTVLDIIPGPEVDIVGDAATWEPDAEYDVVVCVECFEHTAVWQEICGTAYAACKEGGTFIATMGGPGRGAHSAVDGGIIREGEYYGNIDPDRLQKCLVKCGFVDVVVDQQFDPCDVRAVARK